MGGRGEEGLTVRNGGEENKTVVQVLAVTLEGEVGVVGKLEIEVEAAGAEGLEEDGVGGLDGEVIQQDQEATIRWVLG